DGVLIVSPLKIPSINLPPDVSRKILGKGQAGLYDNSRSTARGDNASMPCAASPPSTFCQDHVTTSSRSQARRIANTAEVASQIVSPWRSRAIHSACGI